MWCAWPDRGVWMRVERLARQGRVKRAGSFRGCGGPSAAAAPLPHPTLRAAAPPSLLPPPPPPPSPPPLGPILPHPRFSLFAIGSRSRNFLSFSNKMPVPHSLTPIRTHSRVQAHTCAVLSLLCPYVPCARVWSAEHLRVRARMPHAGVSVPRTGARARRAPVPAPAPARILALPDFYCFAR